MVWFLVVIYIGVYMNEVCWLDFKFGKIDGFWKEYSDVIVII